MRRSKRCRAHPSLLNGAAQAKRLRARDRRRRSEMAERLVSVAAFEGEFSQSHHGAAAGKGTVRYSW